MSAREFIDRAEAEAKSAIERYERGYDMEPDSAIDVPRLAAALRAVLDLADGDATQAEALRTRANDFILGEARSWYVREAGERQARADALYGAITEALS
ncbi:hypothetical protein N866_13545 [Actinotalea ferrariae CF5-4]|uniref:Uncharacterized protein n=1 Tax=Actinotalea ferrariae CF5-4 TaxID=948458 RepID=A0A021VSV4_9CELL|nr:hypothetical protein [Actinotalea ferrariae]EYR64269.1 hypothetical protein N866_13545 [Actinotalea ferrariae CF5-4]